MGFNSSLLGPLPKTMGFPPENNRFPSRKQWVSLPKNKVFPPETIAFPPENDGFPSRKRWLPLPKTMAFPPKCDCFPSRKGWLSLSKTMVPLLKNMGRPPENKGFKPSMLASKSSLLGLCTVFFKRGLRPLYFLNRLFVGRGVLVGV